MRAKHWTAVGLSLLLTVAALGGEFNPARHAPVTSPSDAAEPQRIILRLRDSATATLRAKTTAEAGDVAVRKLAGRSRISLRSNRELVPGLQVMEFTPDSAGEPLAVSLARLRADPDVMYAEVDARRHAHAVPTDPLFSGQWYLQAPAAAPSAVNALAAWDLANGGPGVVIADLDTGIRYDHPDLQRAAVGGRLLPGYDFVSVAVVANDGDGRDDDPADPGDWVTSADVATATFKDCTVEGSSWHGTRTAGIIAARANNGTGISGTTWRGFILPVRVLGKCGGFDSDILAGMLWSAGIHVTGVPDNPFPARIENMSLGATGTSCPASYVDVMSQVVARGVLVVASAGNEGGPVDIPANCGGVVGVAGLRHVGTKVGYSNLGPQVALAAPAGNCVNVTAGQPCLYSIDTTSNTGTNSPSGDSYTDQFNSNVGTSFSAPIVAGIAGLMISANGNLDAAQLRARLQEGASKPFPVSSDPAVPQCHVPASASDVQSTECSCSTATCGAGMANALGAVTAALRPIAAIGVPASVSAGQNVLLRADGSAAACGHNIVSYAWSVVPGSASPPAVQGAQTSSATVVAPSSGSFTLHLVVTDDAGRQDSADVVVSSTSALTSAPGSAGSFTGAAACLAAISAALPVVSISPGSATVVAGSGTQSFAATVTNAANTSVNWQVNGIAGGNATLGTISAAGLYTAPATVPTPATVTVTAVSAADSTRSASAQVTVSAPAATQPPATTSSGGGGGGAFDAWLLALLAGCAAARTRRRRAG